LDKYSDIFVIGGGVNGCGIARDAAGRGLSVTLCEQGDLAQGTSSSSTKLIHGGLRYLEYYEFSLVRKALAEREVLLRIAPHIIQPIRLLLPYHKGLRPAWLIRLALFLYDNMGGRKLLPASKTVDLRDSVEGGPLKKRFKRAFEYSDCTVDDARLVILNAMAARDNGAHIYTRSRVLSAQRIDSFWTIRVLDVDTATEYVVHSKVLVNASGPWVSEVIEKCTPMDPVTRLRLVKGSHIIVPKLYAHSKSYTLQGKDGRIVFTIPFKNDFTLIGTTELDYDGDLENIEVQEEEVSYLCDFVSDYFLTTLSPKDVVFRYAGIRPLFDEGVSAAQAATRDYILELNAGEEGAAPLLNIIGGKITTYRVLAEEALAKIRDYFPSMGKDWTARKCLPGGDIGINGYETALSRLRIQCPFLRVEHAQRLIGSYGTLAFKILEQVADTDALGEHFGADLYAAEVTYLMEWEWARTADDVLQRRGKLCLYLDSAQVQKLSSWMLQQTALPEDRKYG